MGIHPIVVIWLCGFAVLKEYSTLGRILAVKKFSVVPQFNTAVRKLGSQSSITLCLKLEMVQQISISLAFQLMCVSATSVPLWLTYIKVRSSLLGVISHHQVPTGEGANHSFQHSQQMCSKTEATVQQRQAMGLQLISLAFLILIWCSWETSSRDWCF